MRLSGLIRERGSSFGSSGFCGSGFSSSSLGSSGFGSGSLGGSSFGSFGSGLIGGRLFSSGALNGGILCLQHKVPTDAQSREDSDNDRNAFHGFSDFD